MTWGRAIARALGMAVRLASAGAAFAVIAALIRIAWLSAGPGVVVGSLLVWLVVLTLLAKRSGSG